MAVRSSPSAEHDAAGPAEARRFGRARDARAGALVEDYAELIADLEDAGGRARIRDIARSLGVSHATVVKTVHRLRRDELVTGEPHQGLVLTDSGRALADRVRRRHRLVVSLLLAVGVPTDDAEADAEGIEHHVSEATLAAFARFLAG